MLKSSRIIRQTIDFSQIIKIGITSNVIQKQLWRKHFWKTDIYFMKVIKIKKKILKTHDIMYNYSKNIYK